MAIGEASIRILTKTLDQDRVIAAGLLAQVELLVSLKKICVDREMLGCLSDEADALDRQCMQLLGFDSRDEDFILKLGSIIVGNSCW